jgi:hypothetical protein
VVQLAFGAMTGPALGFLTASIDLAVWLQISRMGLLALAFSVTSFLMGFASLGVAIGLMRGRNWSWKASIALCILYLPTGCGPASLVLFAVLMDPGCRAHFNWNPECLDSGGVDSGI